MKKIRTSVKNWASEKNDKNCVKMTQANLQWTTWSRNLEIFLIKTTKPMILKRQQTLAMIYWLWLRTKLRQTGLNSSPGGGFATLHPPSVRPLSAPTGAGSGHHIPPGEPDQHPGPEVPLCLVVSGVRELVLVSWGLEEEKLYRRQQPDLVLYSHDFLLVPKAISWLVLGY